MLDRTIAIFLAASLGVLILSSLRRPVRQTFVVSDNGIVPPKLFEQLAKEDAMLDRPVGDVDLSETTLQPAIAKLSARAGVPIDVNWKALEAAGVDPDVPIKVPQPHPT